MYLGFESYRREIALPKFAPKVSVQKGLCNRKCLNCLRNDAALAIHKNISAFANDTTKQILLKAKDDSKSFYAR